MLSYWFLLKFPWYVVLPVLYGATIAILWPIRAIFEGRAYNHSFTSVVGCFGLVMAITIGGDVLKRMGHVDGFMGTPAFHFVMVITGLAVGLIWQVGIGGPAGDAFHNVISVPILIYFLGTTVFSAFSSATGSEKMAIVAFTLVWMLLVGYDSHTGRLQQGQWLARHYRE